jgi:hypothetical protein
MKTTSISREYINLIQKYKFCLIKAGIDKKLRFKIHIFFLQILGVTYKNLHNSLMPHSPECKQTAKYPGHNRLSEKVCLQNSLMGGSKHVPGHRPIKTEEMNHVVNFAKVY